MISRRGFLRGALALAGARLLPGRAQVPLLPAVAGETPVYLLIPVKTWYQLKDWVSQPFWDTQS